MRNTTSAILALMILSVVAGSSLGEDQYYEIDPAHSSLGFRIRHLYSSVAGRFNKFSGTMTGDFEDPTTLKVVGAVDVNSVDTAVAGRDVHLRNPDFFNIAKFADATFESTGVVVYKDGTSGEVTGNLTIMGVTKKVTFTGRFLGRGPDHKGGARAGFHATATIDKRDFGITYNAILPHGITVLGEEVELVLDIEAIEVAKPKDADGSLAAQIAKYKESRPKSPLSADVREALEAAKAEILEQYNGKDRWQLPVTSTYILDAKGIIRSRLVDVGYTKRMEPEDILKVLRGFRD